jgi:peptidoglycan/xylan/chitin deacetylase (PgdA/CDA1 family)
MGVARSRVRSHVDTSGERAIALTLDDGYRPDRRILELIRAYGIHGTAFIVGEVADSDPGLINELVQLGWLVCSHTDDHSLLTGRSQEAIRSTMLRGMEAVERVVGYRCPYFRAPFGAVDANVVAVADALGVQIIGWEASISDSAPAGTDPDLQLSIAQEHIRPGSILLGHFGGTNSYEVLSRLLAWLGDEGYSVGSVAELIDGNTRPLIELGTSDVTVDTGGTERNEITGAQTTVAGRWSLLGTETGIDVAAVGMILFGVSRRFAVRRRPRRPDRPPEVVVLDDTVPEWELTSLAAAPSARVGISTEGWT